MCFPLLCCHPHRSLERFLAPSVRVWKDCYSSLEWSVELLMPGANETSRDIACVVIIAVAAVALSGIVSYFGPGVVLGGVVVFSVIYISYQEQALQTAIELQNLFKEVVKNLFIVIGDRQELLDALKEANREKGLLMARTVEIEEQAKEYHAETTLKLQKLQEALDGMHSLAIAWSKSGANLAEICLQGIDTLFQEAQKFLQQNNDTLSLDMQMVITMLTDVQRTGDQTLENTQKIISLLNRCKTPSPTKSDSGVE